MREGIILDTELIKEARSLCDKAYKILSSSNLLDLAGSIEKQESIKKLATYKKIKNIKSEIEDLRVEAKKVKEKCKSIESDSKKATSTVGFSFPTLSSMVGISTVKKEENSIKKEEEKVVSIDNPNYNNNLESYIGEIKKSLGLESLEEELGVKIESGEELIHILESLKESVKDNKEEVAQLEVILRQLKQYQEIDSFEKSYTERDGYSSNFILSDEERIEKEVESVQVSGGSAVRVETEYIEYKDIKDYLSERQQQIMGYIYKTEGSKKAYEYYLKLEDQINQLKGMEKAILEYNKIKEAGKGAGKTITTSSLENIYGASSYGSSNLYYSAKKTSQEYMTEYMHSTIKGVVNGVEGFKESWGNINNSKATELDYERMYLIEALQNDEELAEGLEETYQFGESVGNMLPTIVVGAAVTIGTGGVGAPAVVTNVISKAATSAMIFGSSYATKKHQNLLSGYTEEDSKKSAVVSAISETVLEEALGTLPGVGKSSENAIVNMIKEGGQEAVQELVGKVGDKVILDSKLDIGSCIEDASRSFLYGALISGTFQAGETILYKGSKIVINSETLKKLKTAVSNKSEVDVQKILKSLVKHDEDNSVLEESSDMQKKIDKMHRNLQLRIKEEGVPSLLNMNLQTFAYGNNQGILPQTKLREISNRLNNLGYNSLELLSHYYQTGKTNLITRQLNLREDLSNINFVDLNQFLSAELLRMQNKINQGQKVDENTMLKVYQILQEGPKYYSPNTLVDIAKEYNILDTPIVDLITKSLSQYDSYEIDLQKPPWNQNFALFISPFITKNSLKINNSRGVREYNSNQQMYQSIQYPTDNEYISHLENNFEQFLNSKYGQKFWSKLTVGEFVALNRYTKGSTTIQVMASKGKFKMPSNQSAYPTRTASGVKKDVEAIDSALQKAPKLEKNTVFYRGDNLYNLNQSFGFTSKEQIIQATREKRVLTNKGYWSTGVNSSGSFGKELGRDIAIEIKSKANKQVGAYINEISDYSSDVSQNEFLIKRNGQYKFTNAYYDHQGIMHLELEIVGFGGE